jgi:hypothetical protein
MFTTERLLWLFVAAVVVAIFYVSGDGRYRYPCQDPTNWSTPECLPPICTATKQCPEDLLGGTNG